MTCTIRPCYKKWLSGCHCFPRGRMQLFFTSLKIPRSHFKENFSFFITFEAFRTSDQIVLWIDALSSQKRKKAEAYVHSESKFDVVIAWNSTIALVYFLWLFLWLCTKVVSVHFQNMHRFKNNTPFSLCVQYLSEYVK